MSSFRRNTPFSLIYNSFLSKVTDDMYMELTKADTYQMMQELLLSAIYRFEFPRFDIYNYKEGSILEEAEDGTNYTEGYFYDVLTAEEINIISTYMVVEWLGQQLASVENVRMKYSGSDFKFTSQANHMAKIQTMKKQYEQEGFHLQRLYKRRKKDEEGRIVSTFDQIMEDK